MGGTCAHTKKKDLVLEKWNLKSKLKKSMSDEGCNRYFT
jgi:hypothetical protein